MAFTEGFRQCKMRECTQLNQDIFPRIIHCNTSKDDSKALTLVSKDFRRFVHTDLNTPEGFAAHLNDCGAPLNEMYSPGGRRLRRLGEAGHTSCRELDPPSATEARQHQRLGKPSNQFYKGAVLHLLGAPQTVNSIDSLKEPQRAQYLSSGPRMVLHAAEMGHVDVVHLLLPAVQALKDWDQCEITLELMRIASRYGDGQLLQLLLASGLYGVQQHLRLALEVAGDAAIAQQLVDAGANPSEALTGACQSGNVQLAKILLSVGGMVDAKAMFLGAFCRKGRELVPILVEQLSRMPLPPLQHTSILNSGLRGASMSLDFALLEYFEEQGAEKSSCYNPLPNNPDFLRRHSADVSFRQQQVAMAAEILPNHIPESCASLYEPWLERAASGCLPEVVILLLERAPDMQQAAKDSALLGASRDLHAEASIQLETVRALLDASAHAPAGLHAAAKAGNVALLEVLLPDSAALSGSDAQVFGREALEAASKSFDQPGMLDVVARLLSAGAPASAISPGAAVRACAQRNYEAARLLVSEGGKAAAAVAGFVAIPLHDNGVIPTATLSSLYISHAEEGMEPWTHSGAELLMAALRGDNALLVEVLAQQPVGSLKHAALCAAARSGNSIAVAALTGVPACGATTLYAPIALVHAIRAGHAEVVGDQIAKLYHLGAPMAWIVAYRLLIRSYSKSALVDEAAPIKHPELSPAEPQVLELCNRIVEMLEPTLRRYSGLMEELCKLFC